MKQIFQSLRDGRIELLEVPAPKIKKGHILIETRNSVISSGTERMLVKFGKANLFQKAKQQPEKVRQALTKIRTDGVVPTIESILSKLDQPLPLGYCNSGIIQDLAEDVGDFSVGDRVVSNGPHSDIICVAKNLCAKIPDNVDDETAAFTPLGAIALQGIRLASPMLGESFVVFGLGLIGLMAVQLLKANGCTTLGIDVDPRKVEIARSYGSEAFSLLEVDDPVGMATAFSGNRGVDGVLIAASTESSEPIHQAAEMCRKRGRIVLIGVTGMQLSRTDFYEKELGFQVSCSYGPGRYDVRYEEKGQDYPIGFVRWTLQRNFEAVLQMMSNGSLNVSRLITHRFKIVEAPGAYEALESDGSVLGIVLNYDDHEADKADPDRILQRTISYAVPRSGNKGHDQSPVLGVIGCGNYATRVMIPALKNCSVRLKAVASESSRCGHVARKFGFEKATTQIEEILSDEEITAVVILTRHDSHASLVSRALESGKHVFVEKPLAIEEREIQEIEKSYWNSRNSGKAPMLVVGFNRRFAPQVVRIKNLLDPISEPKAIVVTVNSGSIAQDHWTQDREIGGGRIIGEACHFVDLTRYLSGGPADKVEAFALGGREPKDSVTFTLGFENGSVATVHYLSNGHNAYQKERIEVFCAGKILVLDNFNKLRGYGWSNFKRMNLIRQDKGHQRLIRAFVDGILGKAGHPIPFEELLEVSRAVLKVDAQLQSVA